MNTETEIKNIAEQLRYFVNNDNDAPRFIKEYLGEFLGLEENISEIKELEEKIEALEDKIRDAINVLE